jgi:hypothetical protein
MVEKFQKGTVGGVVGTLQLSNLGMTPRDIFHLNPLQLVGMIGGHIIEVLNVILELSNHLMCTLCTHLYIHHTIFEAVQLNSKLDLITVQLLHPKLLHKHLFG